MFPLSPDAISQKLTPKDFSIAFRKLWAELSHKFFKFERLQSYQEPENPSWSAFQRGNHQRARSEMLEARAKDAPRYIDACHKGIQLIRVRAIELPLSAYLKWEFETYKISAKYGERILVIDLTDGEFGSEFKQSMDFNLFDDVAVLVPTYDSGGKLDGAFLIDDPEHVERFGNFSRELIKRSEPLAVFERRQHLE
jgi:hypothetical protein